MANQKLFLVICFSLATLLYSNDCASVSSSALPEYTSSTENAKTNSIAHPLPTTSATTHPPITTTTPSTTTSSEKPPTPTTKPAPTTPPSTSTISPTPPTSPPSTTAHTTHSPPTPSPNKHDRTFDLPSFIGGVILSLGLAAIGYVVYKFYKTRTDPNYRSL